MTEARTGWRWFRTLARKFTKVAWHIKNIARKVGKGIKNLWNKIIGHIKRAVARLKGFFIMIKNKLQKIINFKFIKRVVKTIIPCIKTAKSIGTQIFKVVKGIVKKITTLASRGYAGFAQVFVDLVCNFDKFRAAVHQLVRGIKEG
ncbi:MAG: hypothetical protein ACKO96_29120, partial [Flammeovirgaceae bacterium]